MIKFLRIPGAAPLLVALAYVCAVVVGNILYRIIVVEAFGGKNLSPEMLLGALTIPSFAVARGVYHWLSRKSWEASN